MSKLILTSVVSLALAACTSPARPPAAVDTRPPVDLGSHTDAATTGDASTSAEDAGTSAEDASASAVDAATSDGGRGGPSPEALTSWTLLDVIADALARTGGDAALVSAGGDAVRVDGTIDLTEPPAGTSGSSGGWHVILESSTRSTRWSYEYEPYDLGTAWPSLTEPTYIGRPTVPSSPTLPDSDALIAAYEADPVCRVPAPGLSSIDLYQPEIGGPTEIRVTSGGQTATFLFDASGLTTSIGCAL